MKLLCGARSIFDVIAKRTTKTTTTTSTRAKAIEIEKISNDERQCLHSAVQSDQIRAYNEIPGPEPLPILGNTWR